MRDLSDSWVWESPTNANTEHQNNSQVLRLRFYLELKNLNPAMQCI
jgi:hypothetical protein